MQAEIQPLVYEFTAEDFAEKRVFAQFVQDLTYNNKSFYQSFIMYRNLKVYSMFMIELIDKCNIEIEFISVRQNGTNQGIDTSVHNARMKLCDGSNDETKSGFVFMSNKWDSPVPLICAPIRFRDPAKEQLRLMNPNKTQYGKWFIINNIWEEERINWGCGWEDDGSPRIKKPYIQRQSWVGNYGIVIEQKAQDYYRLYCSCGATQHPNVDFQDMIADVKISGNYRPRFQCSDVCDLDALKKSGYD